MDKSQTVSAPEWSGCNAKLRSWATVQPSRRGVRVVRVPNEDTAAKRAHWLAELATALEQARQLVKELAAQQNSADAVELYARIEAAKCELQSMRLSRLSGGGQQFDPEWTKDIPWKRSA